MRHRHHGRLSSEFLPPQGSLYNAMQAIIGAGLRERYNISEQLPTDLERLVKALNGAHPLGEQPKRAGHETLSSRVNVTANEHEVAGSGSC
jgi:hypothetical protein